MIRGFGAAAAGKGSEFVGDPMNWIDFLAIFPFYVRQIWSNFVDLRFLRVIRLARILRSLKSARYGSLGAVVVDIVKNSVGALFIPVYFMILALVGSAAAARPAAAAATTASSHARRGAAEQFV